MSRSRLLRSQSTDNLFDRTLSSYSSLACDNSYRLNPFDYLDPPPYGQGFQSRHDRRFSQHSGTNGIDTNTYQRDPVKERRVTWAPILESTPTRDVLPQNLERSTKFQSNAYRNSNPSCPIHGYEGHENLTTDRLNRYDLYTGSYNSRPSRSSLYEIPPATRDISSRCNSILYGPTEPRISRDSFRSANAPCLIPHRYSSFSNLRSPFLNMGYYPATIPKYHFPVNSGMIAPSNLQRSKWRRSIIGLNSWNIYH